MPTASPGARHGTHRGTMTHGITAGGTGRTGITVGTTPGTMIITGIVPTITAAGTGIPGTMTPGTMAAGTGLITITVITATTVALTIGTTTTTATTAAEGVSLLPTPGQWPWVATGTGHSPLVEALHAVHRTAAARQPVLPV